MRATLALDDQLVAEAQRLTGVNNKNALVRAALTALVERESARRLTLGGSDPQVWGAPDGPAIVAKRTRRLRT